MQDKFWINEYLKEYQRYCFEGFGEANNTFFSAGQISAQSAPLKNLSISWHNGTISIVVGVDIGQGSDQYLHDVQR